MRVMAVIMLLLGEHGAGRGLFHRRPVAKPGRGTASSRIAPCGTAYCGTVVWASDQAKKDAAKAARSQLIGTQLLTGLKETRPGFWQGTIFIPDRNMRATAKIQLARPRTAQGLRLRGAVICRSQYWNRYDQPLPE